jgi:excisionase family DNA binding protein
MQERSIALSGDRAYLTVAELRDELQVSAATAYAFVARGSIPHVRVGRSIRVHRDTLDAWRREQEETSGKLYD